jgi:acyl carrier protein|tara:strand:+ start:1716 stop:1958 length:243 start_codon:yes stop_codon:yes gene_type:complete
MNIEKVQIVFQEVFEDPGLKILPEMTAKDVVGWDSFNHINLIMELESAFDIIFSTDEIVEMANVGDMIVILQRKGIDVSW